MPYSILSCYRYIFTVVQRRIPSDAFFTGGKNPSNNLSNPWEKIVDVLNIRSATARNPNNNANDSDSSAGASLEGSEQGDDAENENPIDAGDRDQQMKGNNGMKLSQRKKNNKYISKNELLHIHPRC